jgi:uncharacterized membrane protein (DUF106 family)
MRSEIPWKENRFLWQRFGPAVLSLAIVGAGVIGAIRIVQAQDGQRRNVKLARVADTVREPQEQRKEADQEAARKELEALMKQRSELDRKIESLRTKLGEPRLRERVRILTPEDATRSLSPEDRKRVDEAMKRAEEAMKLAQEAMAGVRSVLPEIGVMPDLPYMKITPRAYRFFFDDKNMDVRAWNGKEWEKFHQEWKKYQPEFEKGMREFQKRMEEWQRDFSERMRRRFRDMEREEASSEKPESEEKPAEKSKERPQTKKDSNDIL